MKRISVPILLERQVKIEAGHRCAIPTCKQYPVELAHIIPYSKCKEHKFDNLIALCPNHHWELDHGKLDLNDTAYCGSGHPLRPIT